LKKGVDPLTAVEPSILVVLSGSVRLEREDGLAAETAGPGDVVGIYETLGGVTFRVRAEVEVEGKALRFLRSDVLDLLADDIGLLRGIFSALLRVPEQTSAPQVH
jgi:CRP-like cAMP-binding protein